MKASKISWLNGGNTFNPWIGCTPVSAACANCYAKRENARRRWCGNFYRDRHITSDSYWRQPIAWNKASDPARPTLVFCGSLCDIFECDTALYTPRARLWDLIQRTPNLLWLLLTKRPEYFHFVPTYQWLIHPPKNVWFGVTAENQQEADRRIPILLDFPCAGRFVSCEPLLGMVDLEPWLHGPRRLDWVIVGGERGPGSRETTHFAFKSLWRDCRGYGVPFFFKQFGDRYPDDLKKTDVPFATCKEFPGRFGVK